MLGLFSWIYVKIFLLYGMKAKLSKNREEYVLSVDKGTHQEVIGHSFEAGKYKLSKQNCDEIFGVVDVEKLAFEHSNDLGGRCGNRAYKSFKEGFNTHAELNKDKVFTLEDMEKAYLKGVSLQIDFPTFQESLQQPTEITVEIVTECPKSGCDIECDIDCYIPNKIPKLDSEGQLILKKINNA